MLTLIGMTRLLKKMKTLGVKEDPEVLAILQACYNKLKALKVARFE